MDFCGPAEWHHVELVPQAILDAKNIGANYFQPVPTWYTPDTQSSVIHPCDAAAGCLTPSDAQIISWM